MALFLPGPIVSSIKGKVAGTTFSRNVAGATFRNKFIPQRKQSVLKSNINNRWQFLSQNYLSLNASQRAAWASYATNFTFFNKLGTPVAAKANVVATTTWLFEFQIYGTMTPNPVVYYPPDVLNNVSFSVDPIGPGGYADMLFDPSPSDQYVIIYCSPPYYNNNSQYWQQRVRQLKLSLVSSGDTTIDFLTEFFNMYPLTLPGQKFTFAWRRLNYDCYAWSPLQYFDVVIP